MTEVPNFYLDFQVTGAERKRLVNAIADYVQDDAHYLGAPTFAYRVDYFTIDKNGVVSFDSRADSEEIEGLLEALANQGFVSASSNPGLPAEEMVEDTATEFAVEIPGEYVNMENLTKLLEAKGGLIKKALGVDALPVEERDGKVAFPWFTLQEDDDANRAHIHLITALCEMSRRQKRITATEKPVESEKYAFRCFLLRLGFIGPQYKQERKILLKNLSGNGSYRSGDRQANGGE